MTQSIFDVELLFNANKVYDRGIIDGVGLYLNESQCRWNIYIEEDFKADINQLTVREHAGIIADFDNPVMNQFFNDNPQLTVVGIGSSYHDLADYPQVPYVATDNPAIIRMAVDHLKDRGIENFAFYGIPNSSYHRWGRERLVAFEDIMRQDGFHYWVYEGYETSATHWNYQQNRLADWLQNLPLPTGIIAVTDARARHLLQVCEQLNILVPEQMSIIGIDNEELARYLSRISLSSIEQGTRRMGYLAAQKLDAVLSGQVLREKITVVPPNKLYQRQSTDFKSITDPYVVQAMHYIRLNACKGIKVEQVIDFVGISRSNLELRFQEFLNKSIHQHIHEIKIEQAKQLLLTSTYPMQEIADRCGYPSLQYMYSVFKKDTGFTPKQFVEHHHSPYSDQM